MKMFYGHLTQQDRRHGDVYNIEELKKMDEELIHETLQYFSDNIQDLETELIDNEEINTEEIRSILKGMEYLCDDIDDLKEN